MQFDGCPTEQMAGHFQRPREDFFASFAIDGKAARCGSMVNLVLKFQSIYNNIMAQFFSRNETFFNSTSLGI